MIPTAIAITTTTLTPKTIPKIIPTLPFLVVGLSVTAGVVGSGVTNKKTKFTGNVSFASSAVLFCAVLVTVPTAFPEGFSSGTPKRRRDSDLRLYATEK